MTTNLQIQPRLQIEASTHQLPVVQPKQPVELNTTVVAVEHGSTSGERNVEAEAALAKGKGIEKMKVDKVKDKDKDKWHHRCCTKGHSKEVCTVPIFCTAYESEDHVQAKCPIKKRPRPVAHAVGYAVDDLGFYHIPHAPYSTCKKDGKTALIKVIGAQLTVEEIRGHLKRLIRANFEWDIQLHVPNTWVVPFPSKAELRRMINFGSADLRDGMSLKFEEFEEVEYFGTEIPQVWMKVLNLPKVLHSYEVLRAVGSMFGATQRCDMITTRKNNFGRFKVGVLNPCCYLQKWTAS